MTMSYEEHKVQVDLEYPTPEPVYYLHKDNPLHSHDDHALAFAHLQFGSISYDLEVHQSDPGPQIVWIAYIPYDGEDGPRTRQTIFAATWEQFTTSTAILWERLCEEERIRLATGRYSIQILKDAGIVFAPAGIADASSFLIGFTGDVSIPFTPAFDPAVTAYALATPSTYLNLSVTVDEGATVTWLFAAASSTGLTMRADLDAGVNVVTCTVSRPDYTPTVYTFSITRNV